MKTLKIVIALAAVIGLATLTVGISLAHYTNTFYDSNRSYATEADTETWWTQMREYMEARWNGIEDEEWYDSMIQYMEEHWNEVRNQEWFTPMLEYMEEHGYRPYGYGSYVDNYYGPRNYGRGFGCGGW